MSRYLCIWLPSLFRWKYTNFMFDCTFIMNNQNKQVFNSFTLMFIGFNLWSLLWKKEQRQPHVHSLCRCQFAYASHYASISIEVSTTFLLGTCSKIAFVERATESFDLIFLAFQPQTKHTQTFSMHFDSFGHVSCHNANGEFVCSLTPFNCLSIKILFVCRHF